jgi:hypothetical protein
VRPCVVWLIIRFQAEALEVNEKLVRKMSKSSSDHADSDDAADDASSSSSSSSESNHDRDDQVSNALVAQLKAQLTRSKSGLLNLFFAFCFS